MEAKLFALGAALLLALLVLNAPVSFAQQDVEPGIDGLLDFQTNLDNTMGLVRYVTGNFSLSTDWIKGIMSYIEAFPDNAGLAAGFYLSAVPILMYIAYITIMIVLVFIPVIGWIIYLPVLLFSIVIDLILNIVGGLIGLIGGYFVYSNGGEGGMSRIAGIVQMLGGGLQMTVIGAIIGLLAEALSLILQLLGMLGVA